MDLLKTSLNIASIKKIVCTVSKTKIHIVVINEEVAIDLNIKNSDDFKILGLEREKLVFEIPSIHILTMLDTNKKRIIFEVYENDMKVKTL
jgi:hypothetical protein